MWLTGCIGAISDKHRFRCCWDHFAIRLAWCAGRDGCGGCDRRIRMPVFKHPARGLSRGSPRAVRIALLLYGSPRCGCCWTSLVLSHSRDTFSLRSRYPGETQANHHRFLRYRPPSVLPRDVWELHWWMRHFRRERHLGKKCILRAPALLLVDVRRRNERATRI